MKNIRFLIAYINPLFLLLAVVPAIPLLAGSVTVYEALLIMLLVFFAQFTGNLITSRLSFFTSFERLTQVVLNVYLGIFVFSLGLLLHIPFLFFIGVAGCSVWLSVKYLQQKSDGNRVWKNLGLLLFIIICLLPFYNYNELLIRFLHRLPDWPTAVPKWTDPDFFISQVASLREGTIYNAIYQSNTPLDYQFGSFIPAAFIAEFTQTTAQVGLYGVWITLCNLLQFLLIFELSKRFNNGLFKAGIVGGMVHLLLASWNNKTFFWEMPTSETSIGFLGPGQSASYCCVLPLALLIIHWCWELKQRDMAFSTHEGIFMIAVLGLIASTKLAIFLPVGLWLGLIALMELYQTRNYRLLIYVVCGGILGLVAYSVCFSHAASKIQVTPGYYLDFIKSMAGLQHHGYWIAVLVFIGLILTWGGFAWLGIWFGLRDSKYKYYVASAVLTLLFICLFVNVIKIERVWPDLNIHLEASFDLGQFLRCSLFLLRMISLPFLVSVFFAAEFKTSWLRVVRYGLVVFMVFGLSGYILKFVRNGGLHYSVTNYYWINAVRAELAQLPVTGKLAIDPKAKEEAPMLVASEVGQFYVSLSEQNYNGSLLHAERWKLFDELHSEDENLRKHALTNMKEGGVQYIIVPPTHLERYKALQQKGLLTNVPHTTWIYTIN